MESYSVAETHVLRNKTTCTWRKTTSTWETNHTCRPKTQKEKKNRTLLYSNCKGRPWLGMRQRMSISPSVFVLPKGITTELLIMRFSFQSNKYSLRQKICLIIFSNVAIGLFIFKFNFLVCHQSF